MKSRAFGVLIVIVLALGLGFAWHRYQAPEPLPEDPAPVEERDWLMDLHSANPQVAAEAEQHLKRTGADAIPEIREALRDPASDEATLKAAMKAAGMLGAAAAPVVPDVAAHLADPSVTADAAVALSYLGRDAFGPLRDALKSEDPVVRREALRSLGKLRERAPLESRTVVPLLLEGMEDSEASVRTVAATYLGIIADYNARVVPVLIGALKDDDPEVRIAAATALGSFPEAASSVIPALRKATADSDPDVAREAGVAIVKLQGSRPPK